MQHRDTTFIYALCEPETGVVRYIGKSNDPQCRYRRHLKNARDGQVFHCPTWIRSVLAVGQFPTLTIIEECALSDWKAREVYWIAKYRADGFDLTNSKDGGDGLMITDEIRLKMRMAKVGKAPHNKGKKTSEEVRQKQSVAAKARVARNPEVARTRMLKALSVSVQNRTGKPGRKKSPEEIERIRQSLLGNTRRLGHKYSEEQCKQISERLKGHPTSDETKRKIGEANRKRQLEKRANKHQFPSA